MSMNMMRKYSSRFGLRETGKTIRKNYNVCGFYITVSEISHHLDSLKQQFLNLEKFEIRTFFNFLKESPEKEFITEEDLINFAYHYRKRLDRITLRELIKLHDTSLTATLDFEDFCSFLTPHNIEKVEIHESTKIPGSA